MTLVTDDDAQLIDCSQYNVHFPISSLSYNIELQKCMPMLKIHVRPA